MMSNGDEIWCTRKWAVKIFLTILALHALAIFLFTKGFLLTRSELPYHSQCSDVSQSPCISPPPPPSPSFYHTQQVNGSSTSHHNHHLTPGGTGCWTEPSVDRLIIIIFDALRFDFVAPSSFFQEKKPWMDKFKVLHELASQRGSSARIFKALADPPTTSLQRLKGLTTGGLPTFIDVGNSFGAPAIVEDNLIYQLVENGKRVVMMGDDTWLQLFPHHFNQSHPFPSFNVKDLDTVDNGCIEHLFPSLHRDDWDVLVAHFLGVDHAGHIYGVDSIPMSNKLEQYNRIMERVVEILETQSKPGGLHENTLLLVMGDHGQTLNGDHGGGSAEEVETSLFALSLKNPPALLPEGDASSCQLDMEGRKICISSIEQLDFVATVSALLGLPFPFGSIGRVNPDLYALASGRQKTDNSSIGGQQGQLDSQGWMWDYVNALCINSWQVKKYIDFYSASSLIGFSDNDLMDISNLYAEAQELWSNTVKLLGQDPEESSLTSLSMVKKQVDAYSDFLRSVSRIARSKWTEFNLEMMGVGLLVMLISLFIHVLVIKRLDKSREVNSPSYRNSRTSILVTFAYIVVMIRAGSFLSNSFILEEGKVASFLLATIGMLQFRYAAMQKKMLLEALGFVLLVPALRFGIELGQLKQAVNSSFLKIYPSWMSGIDKDSWSWICITESFPILALTFLGYILYRIIARFDGILKYVISLTISNYLLIAAFWILDTNLLNFPEVLGRVLGNVIPRIIYATCFFQVSLLAAIQFVGMGFSHWNQSTTMKVLSMLAAWSPVIILLSGKQGPLNAVAFLVGGLCISKLMRLEQDAKDGSYGTLFYSSPVIQWSLLSACLFFSTGHWCAFDGLRYAAAFIGFDEFNLIRQAILLTIDTFGFSHILPVLGLPFLVACQESPRQTNHGNRLVAIQLCQVYLLYGLVMAIPVTFTIICVAIQRRHLMVWGLFAPKFVFDVVGLMLTDILILLASVYYLKK